MYRFISNFQSHAGDKYRISIWDALYNDAPVEFCTGPNGFDLSYEGDINNPSKVFIPSRLEFQFNVENQLGEDFILDCATGEPQRFRVDVTKSSSLGDGGNAKFWSGFIQGEGINIADDWFPFPVNLSASDCAFFRDYDYEQSGPITGMQTVSETILNCLNICGYDYATGNILATSVEWSGRAPEIGNQFQGMATGDDPCNLTGINQWAFFQYLPDDKFAYKNCQEVIENLGGLLRARFFQSGGIFRFAQIDNFVKVNQRYYFYDKDGNKTGPTNLASTLTVDRDNLYQNRGIYSILPGIRSVERQIKFRRNYLEGLEKTNVGRPTHAGGEGVYRDIGLLDIISKQDISSAEEFSGVGLEKQRFTFKVSVSMRMREYSGASTPQPFDMPTAWIFANESSFKPLFRITIRAKRKNDGVDYYYAWALAERDPRGIEVSTSPRYRELLETRDNWPKFHFILPNNLEIYRGWTDVDDENKYYEFIPTLDFSVNKYEYENDLFESEDASVNVEAVTPEFLKDETVSDIEEMDFFIDLLDVYNTREKRWVRDWSVNYPDAYDELEWNVDACELIAHGDLVENRAETARQYTVLNPDNYRRVVKLPDIDLIALDDRTWHNVKVWNGTRWITCYWWKRDDGEKIPLNYLALREELAMNRRGVRLFNGTFIVTGDNMPEFHNPLEMNGKWLIIQGTYTAAQNEWRNAYLMELTRDVTDLNPNDQPLDSPYFEEKLSESAARFSIPGDSLQDFNSGSVGGTPLDFDYEFASGVNGLEFEPNLDLTYLSGVGNNEVNRNLWLFQDTTKLIYPFGYTIDFDDNKIIPTHEFEDAFIELYAFNRN